MSENIGPVQLVAVDFDPDADFERKILDALARLEVELTRAW